MQWADLETGKATGSEARRTIKKNYKTSHGNKKLLNLNAKQFKEFALDLEEISP